MITKQARTLDEYKRAGGEMRLMKTLGAVLAVDISKVLYAKDTDKLLRALRMIDEVCSNAEDNMFHDFPEVDNSYTDVFYGSVGDSPRTAIDEEVIGIARETADALFR